MQASPKKSFRLETHSHTILTTYQPSNIHFLVTDKRNNCTRTGLFYDCTLPDSVKEECEAVGDLFGYLQSKSAEEMQVDGDSLKFKVVRIKKERWYSLSIGRENAPPKVVPMEEEKMEEQKSEAVDPMHISIKQERDQLLSENQQLRQEVERLEAVNLHLQQRIQSYERIGLKVLMQNGIIDQNEREIQDISMMEGLDSVQAPMMESQSQSEQQPMRRLKLTPQKNNPHYRHQGDIITKITNQSSIFAFEQVIKRAEKVTLGVQLVTDLHNHWIIFGVMTRQNDRPSLPYCYFQKGCLAFSGSLGIIYNEMDTIDLYLKPKKGDRIELRLNGRAEWIFNGKVVYIHDIGVRMREKELYPYLMLSGANGSVRIINEEIQTP